MTEMTFQGEESECGLACLAMIAAHHGHQSDMASLRARVGAHSRGMSAMDIINSAAAIDLNGRGVRVELDDLAHLSTPAILHWSLTHFVVLDSVRRGIYYIRDPSTGVRRLDRHQVSDCFSGVALEFERGQNFAPVKEKAKISLFALWRGRESVSRPIIQLVVLSALVEIAALTVPFFMQLATDELIPSQDIGFLAIISVCALSIMIVQALGTGLRHRLIELLRASLSIKMSRNLFAHMTKLPASFFQLRHYGDIQSRFRSLDAIHSGLSGPLIAGLFDALAATSVILIMAYYSISITLVCLSAVAVYCVARWVLHKPTVAANEEVIISSAKRDSLLLESIRGIETLKTYSRLSTRASQYMNLVCEVAGGQICVAKHTIRYELLSALILAISVVSTILIGSVLVIREQITLGMLVALIGFRSIFTTRFISAFDGLMQVRMLDLHAQRVSEVMSEPQSPQSPDSTKEVRHSEIEFNRVSFSYPGSRHSLIENLSLAIPSNSSVAIVGKSGCGKTTIGKLVSGLLLPQRGIVSIGGAAIEGDDAGGVHRIAVVSQSDVIFSGSVLDNIVLWAPEYDLSKVHDACDAACILEDIDQLVMGMHAAVGEGGALLSGGQRQRLALARALYSRPAVLIMDEATSNLDIETERKILANVGALGITVLQIAHRPQAIVNCQWLIDMEQSPIAIQPNSNWVDMHRESDGRGPDDCEPFRLAVVADVGQIHDVSGSSSVAGSN